MRDRKSVREAIPKDVIEIANILYINGYEAYLVGGSVRDLLLDRTPKDFDIATNAVPQKIIELFPKSIAVGAQFGTVAVLMQGESGVKEYEVTTYRTESLYLNHRWPSKVEFTSSLEEDLSRRDFTINAMAIDVLEKGQDWLIDKFGGVEDLKRGSIRAINDPYERIKEDALRSVRACRFACQLEFIIEEATFEAIKVTSENIKKISAERVRDELMKILESTHPSIGIELLRRTELLKYIMPELLEGVGVDQNVYHAHDVYTHLLQSCEMAENRVRLAALLHDIAKPRTKHGPHFYGHDQMGAQISEDIMKRLKFSNKEVERVSKLIRLHMFNYTKEWKDAAVRRFIISVGSEEMLKDLFALRIADSSSNPKSDFDPTTIQELEKRILDIQTKEHALKVSDLAINGEDLLQLGVKQGPIIGRILDRLFDKVIEDPSLNDHNILIDLAKKEIK